PAPGRELALARARGGACNPPASLDNEPRRNRGNGHVTEEVRVGLYPANRTTERQCDPDRPGARIELAQRERPRERHQRVTARQGQSAGGEGSLTPVSEEVLAIVGAGPLAPQQQLEHFGPESPDPGSQAQEQGVAAITSLEPEREAHRDPERVVADDPEQAASVVLVHFRIDQVLPGPGVEQVRQHDGQGADDCNTLPGSHPQGYRYPCPMPKPQLLLALLAPAAVAAQDLPAYVPINPVLASRSAIYFQPIVSPADGWRTSITVDYSNAIERTMEPGLRQYLFDADLMQVDFWLRRDLSRDWFLVGNVAVRSAHDGFLDSFLNWYHDVI